MPCDCTFQGSPIFRVIVLVEARVGFHNANVHRNSFRFRAIIPCSTRASGRTLFRITNSFLASFRNKSLQFRFPLRSQECRVLPYPWGHHHPPSLQRTVKLGRKSWDARLAPYSACPLPGARGTHVGFGRRQRFFWCPMPVCGVRSCPGVRKLSGVSLLGFPVVNLESCDP